MKKLKFQIFPIIGQYKIEVENGYPIMSKLLENSFVFNPQTRQWEKYIAKSELAETQKFIVNLGAQIQYMLPNT